MDRDPIPLYKILGMTEDERASMNADFMVMAEETEDLFDLCKRFVDKYGIEAVFMSINLFMVLEMTRELRGGRTVESPDKEAVDTWLSKSKALMSDN